MPITAQQVYDSARPGVDGRAMIGCCPATPNFYGRKQRGRETRAKHTAEILRRYEAGESTDAIGASIGATGGLVKTIIRESGGHIKSTSEWKRKHSVNERFFQTIDTEEKAYCLGFMFADGNVSSTKGTVTITQRESDVDVLKKIANRLSSSSPIRIYKNGVGKPTTAHFSVGSNAMCADLISHGCVPNKTFVTKFPFDSIEPNLYRHFVRGYFDGDGCIMYSHGKPSIQASVVGTEEFLNGVVIALNSQLGDTEVRWYTRHPERNHNIRSLVMRRQRDAMALMWWMYDGSTVYMERKMLRYKASVEQYKQNILSCSRRKT